MIASGIKKEEYRTIKPYWEKRLYSQNFDTITFSNGYAKDRRQMVVKCLYVFEGIGLPRWGAPLQKVYVIHLGEILSKNF